MAASRNANVIGNLLFCAGIIWSASGCVSHPRVAGALVIVRDQDLVALGVSACGSGGTIADDVSLFAATPSEMFHSSQPSLLSGVLADDGLFHLSSKQADLVRSALASSGDSRLSFRVTFQGVQGGTRTLTVGTDGKKAAATMSARFDPTSPVVVGGVPSADLPAGLCKPTPVK